MALDPRQANAIRKAVELGAAAKVQRVEYGVYLVPSATREGITHVVTGKRIDGADLECDCEAGAYGKPCHHKAAVMIRKMQASAGVRVLGPAPTPQASTVTRDQPERDPAWLRAKQWGADMSGAAAPKAVPAPRRVELV